MLRYGDLRDGRIQLLRPFGDVGDAVRLGLFDNQFLPISPTGWQWLDGLNNAMPQDGFDRHIVSRHQHRTTAGWVNRLASGWAGDASASATVGTPAAPLRAVQSLP